MSLAWATITRRVMWPLMSSPRMSWARALASSALSASLTPPALPRPPTFTYALTTTRSPMSLAMASACSGVSATPAGSTGKPCEANRSRAWYSKRSTNRHRSPPVMKPPRRALQGAVGRGAHHKMRHPFAAPQHRPAAPQRVPDDEELLCAVPQPVAHHRWGRSAAAEPAVVGRERSGAGRRPYVGADPVHDLGRGGARREDAGDPELLELGDVLVRDDPAAEDHHVVDAPLAHQLAQPGEQRHVRTGEDGQADGVGVLLHDGLDDLLRGLVQAGVDDLHPGVPERAGDHLRATVVPFESGFRDDPPDAFVRHAGQLRSAPPGVSARRAR